MSPPATEAAIAVSSFWPKLIINGSRAEQPRPARAKLATPSNLSFFGNKAAITNAAATTKGSATQTRRAGNHFSIAAKKRRPTVTAPQKQVKAREATAEFAPSVFVI